MNKRVIAALAAIVLALFGVIMLLNYASGADDRAYNNAKLESVLQVTAPIAANTKAENLAGNIKTVKLPNSAIAKGAMKSVSEAAGLATTTGLEPGEQLLLSRFAKEGAVVTSKSKSAVPKGMQEVTITLGPDAAVGGNLTVGDTVGIIVSFTATKGGGSITQLIRNRVQITRISGAVAGQAAGPQLVTFAVATRDAGKIVNATEFGKIWLTKQNADTATGTGGSISQSDVVK